MAVSLLSYCRVAVVVAKYGHTVVKRNQLRRRLRELARVLLIPKLRGLDLVITALPSAYAADFRELAADVERIQLKLTAGLPTG